MGLEHLRWDIEARNWGRTVSIYCITGVLGRYWTWVAHGGSGSSDGMGMIAWIWRWAGCLYSISNSFCSRLWNHQLGNSSLALSRTLLC
jgi:hypothetical protein